MIINWGDAPFKAFITVTYPSGTCTVTGEGQTYTHSGGGTTTFTVKKKGTYTVKAVNGAASTSKTASITNLNQTVSIKLSYELILFDASTSLSTVKNNFTFNQGQTATYIEKSGNYFVFHGGNVMNFTARYNKTIDLTPYKTLQVYGYTTITSNAKFGLSTSAPGYNPSWAKSNTFTSSAALRTIDISSLNGSYYFGIWHTNNGNGYPKNYVQYVKFIS